MSQQHPQYQPVPQHQPQPYQPQPQWVQPQPPKKKRTGLKIVLGIVGLGMVLIIGACSAALSGSGSSDTAEAPKVQVTEKAKTSDKKTTEPKEREATRGERNALDQAQSYIDGQSFSKKGLAHQLKFEKYSKSEVAYAIKNVDVDYMAEAADQAESYLEGQSFSKAELLHQLKFEGYTDAQAEHGVKVAY